jgi:prepilin-type N-terminal cleavage/methylation domain-containing protein
MVSLRSSNRLAQARAQQRGFTLVELMAVVLIVALLGALATYGVRKYILAAKTTEATRMLSGIATAQEEYKSEMHAYLDVSGEHQLSGYAKFYPATAPLKRAKAAWGGAGVSGVDPKVAERWASLGVTTTHPVYYIYGCAAGGVGDDVANPGMTIENFPTGTQGQPWYIAQAVGDLDGDGSVGLWVLSSFSSQVFHTKEEE